MSDNQTITTFEDSLVIVLGLPTTFDEEHRWDLPVAAALKSLYEALGEGSQAFVFATEGYFNDPDHLADSTWHDQFASVMAEAFGDVIQPKVCLELGECGFKYHGGNVADPTSPEGGTDTGLYGRETGDFGGYTTYPVPIRIWSADALNLYRDLYELRYERLGDWRIQGVIIEELVRSSKSCLTMDTSPAHFGPLPDWFRRAGAKSTQYKQAVVVRWNFEEEDMRVMATIPLQAEA